MQRPAPNNPRTQPNPPTLTEGSAAWPSRSLSVGGSGTDRLAAAP